MGFRITTWNVNGIRNPFGYQPWRDKRTFDYMFDTLEADIVVMQETKIQRKDLRDDMVLVPGWDCYFSLPRHKKGYSGVAIYTRQAKCAPIRAEEGVSGILEHPTLGVSYRDLPEEARIGGYPTTEQLDRAPIDAATLDSEGRCVILEFPAFVLVGVYSPAMRDETRDDFRKSFLNALDWRLRNLDAMGKRVFVTGDLNITREEIDSAPSEEAIKKQTMTMEEIMSTPARRIFNQLLVGGRVFGERDVGREKPVMWDVCRGFHEGRKGMYTCWEQKINARPGNYGARIDYVISSANMVDWFNDSNIQEGLMGSDHCPVYAVIKDMVPWNGNEVNICDIMNTEGTFKAGIRQKEYSIRNLLALSGRNLPEFDKRQSIRDMFNKKPSASKDEAQASTSDSKEHTYLKDTKSNGDIQPPASPPKLSQRSKTPSESPSPASASGAARTNGTKRAAGSSTSPNKSMKRSKSGSAPVPPSSEKGQQSLKGFFAPKKMSLSKDSSEQTDGAEEKILNPPPSSETELDKQPRPEAHGESKSTDVAKATEEASEVEEPVVDPVASKESWSSIFARRDPPRCEGHDEPCISLQTKKSGVNCGRSFWMCSRPLGPSGNKERGTQWRCQTFVWSSDWNPKSNLA